MNWQLVAIVVELSRAQDGSDIPVAAPTKWLCAGQCLIETQGAHRGSIAPSGQRNGVRHSRLRLNDG